MSVTTATTTTNYAGIDLSEARQLADLISASVSTLEHLASSTHRHAGNDAKDAEEAAKNSRNPMLTIVSAAGQLMANVRPPSVVAVDLATSVRPSLSPISFTRILF